MSATADAKQWAGEDIGIADIERALALLRHKEGEVHALRTSVLTLVAWVPPEWHDAAEEVLEGLAERHPSRCIVLYPDARDDRSVIDARVSVELFALPGLEQHVAAEVIRLSIFGGRCGAPASIVAPLVLPDLPVFLRWRGPLAFGERPLEQLAGVADRLIVDSGEWEDQAAGFERLPELFENVNVSDIAWARTLPWRAAIAGLWPDVADVRRAVVEGPMPEALLLVGWLRSRLGHEVELEHGEAGQLNRVELDGRTVEPAAEEPKTPSDLLSEQLEQYGRDRVFEQSVVQAMATAGRSPG